MSNCMHFVNFYTAALLSRPYGQFYHPDLLHPLCDHMKGLKHTQEILKYTVSSVKRRKGQYNFSTE